MSVVVEVSFNVPIRRSRWPSFWIGTAAACGSLLVAAGLAGLLLLLPFDISGAVIILICGLLWFGLFFFSYPLQRRCVRALDSRRPGIRLAGGVLALPAAGNTVLYFNLDKPHELRFGWWEYVVKSAGGPTTNTRTVLTHAVLTQAGQQLFLKAEDSIREAQAAGWPGSPPASATPTMAGVRLWASDLVALVETIKAASSKSSA